MNMAQHRQLAYATLAHAVCVKTQWAYMCVCVRVRASARAVNCFHVCAHTPCVRAYVLIGANKSSGMLAFNTHS